MPTPIALSDFRSLLLRHKFRPSKRRGQNFLFDPNLSRAIVEMADLRPGESVLEIGTGCGYLTAVIAPRVRRVLTVEIDPRLSAIARGVLEKHSNVEYLVCDFLSGKSISPEVVKKLRVLVPFVVVANLPYSIAGLTLVSLSEFTPQVTRLVVTVQRELGERCAAAPGSSDRGPLSLLLQLYYRVKVLRVVPPEVFWPRPRVESAIVRMDRTRRPLPESQETRYRAIVSALFRQKRKQIQKSLRPVFGPRTDRFLGGLGIDPSLRPQDLQNEDFLKLAKFGPNEDEFS